MYTKIFLAFMLIVAIGGMALSQSDQAKSLPIKQRGDLKKYNGKRVNITGKLATAVMQHPNLAPAFSASFQNYLDTEVGQIVLISKEDIKCNGEIFIEGKLKIVSLGGKKGTKSSYQNPSIEVDHFECK